MYKIGEVAKKTGVSIRSLRHYDEIKLLQPSSRNDAGYRLYSKKDIMRLQQIISLKQIGFSLKKIHEILNAKVSLKDTISLHLECIENQLLQQNILYQQIKYLHGLLVNKKTISVDDIYKTREIIKMYEQYYSKEQIEQLSKRDFHINEDGQTRYEKEWDNVFVGLALLQQQQVPPEDDRTKPFAEKAIKLKNLFTCKDVGIETNLENMREKVGGAQMLRNHGLNVSNELYVYYAAVLQAHSPLS